jgi:hypothetical protein
MPSIFFTGLPIGTCQDALDTACGLYRTTHRLELTPDEPTSETTSSPDTRPGCPDSPQGLGEGR